MSAQACIENGFIIVRGPAESLRYVSRIPGAKRRIDGVWTVPMTLDSCLEIKNQRIPMADDLRAYGNQQARIRKYIEAIKVQEGEVEPLQPIPIKAPYQLYQHQIKAFNIALALFGRGPKRKEGDSL